MKGSRLTRVAITLSIAASCSLLGVATGFAQSVSLAPGAATIVPPPPGVAPPCFGVNFSPAGDIFNPLTLAPTTIPMGPPGCGLGWPGPALGANVDAFSTGIAPMPGGLPLPPLVASLLFSVDPVATGSGGTFSCAAGVPVFPGGFAADVNSEAALLPFSTDAPADWFLASPNVLGGLPSIEPMPHAGFADGDGAAAAPFFLPHPLGAPFALKEPLPPGDDVDGMDMAAPGIYDFLPPGGDGVPDIIVYYTVDIPTAATVGISGADVVGAVGGGAFLYIGGLALGLDGFGLNTDDIDALVVKDFMGDGVYDPTPATGPDIVYYSLAPGSASIGLVDACLGLKIEEDDILTDGTTIGLPGAPCIAIPAENIGLWTARACGLNPVTGFFGDNVDAIDFHPPIVITTTTTSTTTSTTNTTTTSTTTTTLTPLCGVAPEPDVSCRLADISGAGKSGLQMKDKSPDTKDLLKWKWNKGAATVTADFQSPDVGTSTMRVCLYDSGGKLAEMDLPPGGIVPTCGTKPCWKPTGTKGFKYTNKTGSPSGIAGAKFKEGVAGKSQVQIKVSGKGGFYSSAATGSLALPVTIQLLIDDGFTTECFKTTFTSFLVQDAQTLKAKGP